MLIALIGLTCVAILSGAVLSSSIVSAEELVVDEINVVVPASCSLSGSGMNSHNASIPNGTFNSAIGTSTFNAVCNDSDGFAIYAIGYTDDTDGNNVLTNADLGSTFDIATGTLTSGNNSQWAMKLATQSSPTPTYPITIQNSFDSFHTVPDEYTLVTKRESATDSGENAIGSTFTTTYQAYISPTQPAGTYTGQVKYILVHPNYVDEQTLENAITVIYDANGLVFPNGSTTNTVKYARVCEPGDYVYVGNTPTISKTSNIANDGTMNTTNTSTQTVEDTVTLSGADMLKVELTYGYDNNGWLDIYYNGNYNTGDYYDAFWSSKWESNRETIRETIYIHSDTVSFLSNRENDPDIGYYGYYAKVYPVYFTQQSNTAGENIPSDDCSIVPISGTYMETTDWHGKWTGTIDGNEVSFSNTVVEGEFVYEYDNAEGSILSYFSNRDLSAIAITFYAYNPVTFDMVYAAANKTKTNGYYKIQDLNPSMCEDVTIGETSTVIDIRDNNTYSIGKLKDGNCWLRDNLRLNPTDSTTASNMSSSNTNATDAAISNYLNGGNNNNVSGWSSSAVSSPNDWPANTFVNPYIHVPVDVSNGIYYNYCAATAGTYCYASNISGSYTYDICPANWKLPTKNEVKTLNESDSIAASSLNLTRMGSYSSGNATDETDKIDYQGSEGYYWTNSNISGSSTIETYMPKYNSNNIQNIVWANGGQAPFAYRYSGNSIRCILSTSD